MIIVQINEEKLKEMLAEHFKENIKEILEGSQLEYWVRSEVYKLLAKEIVEKTIKPMITNKKITEMLQAAFDKYVDDKFGD